MARLPRRRTLRRVFATGDDSPDLRVLDLRVALGREAAPGSPKRGEPHGRLRGATNPRTVERSDLRIRPLRRKPLKPGGTARTEHIRDVAVPERSPGDGLGGMWTQDGRVGGGAIDEPQERSPGRGSTFGSVSRSGPREPVCLCTGVAPVSRSDEEHPRRWWQRPTNHAARGVSDDAPWSRPWL